MRPPKRAKAHYRFMQDLQVATLAAGERAWRRVDSDSIRESWGEVLEEFEPVVVGAQVRAASAGASYGAETLVQSSGEWRPPEGFVNPRAFAGVTGTGQAMRAALTAPAVAAVTRISQGLPAGDALKSGKGLLDRLLRTSVADSSRVAAGVDAASRAGVGYIRMINPPSCQDCVLLAGRRYRWNQGFLRHPNCDCVHIPATEKALTAGEVEGLMVDPYAYFESLSESEQDRVFGKGGAQAIRDGADINKVVNARRYTRYAGVSQDDTRRGQERLPEMSDGRLTPEAIYQRAGSRREAVEMLEEHGFILPGGQVPGGSIRGWDYEGYGALGRGGTRVGAREAVERARATGVRDPGSRYTMTEAERRLHDSRARYEAVLQGKNPYGKGPLTPSLAAQAETDFRRWLTTGGQVYN